MYLFADIDRTSKFTYAELHLEATRIIAKSFFKHLISAVPYRIQTVSTDNGIQFTNRKRDTMALMTPFDRTCCQHGIEHRLTKV